MRLTWPERNVVLEAAFDYAHARFDFETGCALTFEIGTSDTFRVEVHDGCHTRAAVLLNVTFDSVESALRYFAPVKQLSLFEREV